jgi:hypothetical protein
VIAARDVRAIALDVDSDLSLASPSAPMAADGREEERMAIDLKTETPVGLLQAALFLPPSCGGRPVQVSSLVRAILAGELEALRFGRRWVKTVEAVQRWGEARARAAGAGPRPARGADTEANRAATERRLREIGI